MSKENCHIGFLKISWPILEVWKCHCTFRPGIPKYILYMNKNCSNEYENADMGQRFLRPKIGVWWYESSWNQKHCGKWKYPICQWFRPTNRNSTMKEFEKFIFLDSSLHKSTSMYFDFLIEFWVVFGLKFRNQA